jgi:hypothetical protein
LHHFFEAQVRNQFSAGENVLSKRTSPSKKRDRLAPLLLEQQHKTLTLP